MCSYGYYEGDHSWISWDDENKKAFVGLYAEYSKKRLFSCLPNVASSKNNCAGPFIDIDEIPFAIWTMFTFRKVHS